MPADQPLVKLSDIADELGVSVMTVSRALRNAAGVKPETRTKVFQMARRLKYRPDPALGVLNMYRHGRRRQAVGEKIAFLTDFPTPDGWRKAVTFVRYFEGVRRRARVLGYEVEPFWLGEKGITPRRASEILRGRGIRGIIIGPLASGHSVLRLHWDYFSAVALGRALKEPDLAAVSAHHFQGMELACAQVVRRGYQRIGYAVTTHDEARTKSAPRAAFQLRQETFPGPPIPPLVLPEFSKDAIVAWARTHKPEVLLTSEQTHYDLLRAGLGRRAPAIAFVHLNVDPASDHAGVDQAHDIVGEHAAALLHLKLVQRETGISLHGETLFIRCVWKEGRGEWLLRSER